MFNIRFHNGEVSFPICCENCFYNSDGICVNHCYLSETDLDPYGLSVLDIKKLSKDCYGFRLDYELVTLRHKLKSANSYSVENYLRFVSDDICDNFCKHRLENRDDGKICVYRECFHSCPLDLLVHM